MTNITLRRALELSLSILAIVMAVILVAALAIQYRIHIANEWQQYAFVPTMNAPTKSGHIMVFAPSYSLIR
jgi:hypothetical protein